MKHGGKCRRPRLQVWNVAETVRGLRETSAPMRRRCAPCCGRPKRRWSGRRSRWRSSSQRGRPARGSRSGVRAGTPRCADGGRPARGPRHGRRRAARGPGPARSDGGGLHPRSPASTAATGSQPGHHRSRARRRGAGTRERCTRRAGRATGCDGAGGAPASSRAPGRRHLRCVALDQARRVADRAGRRDGRTHGRRSRRRARPQGGGRQGRPEHREHRVFADIVLGGVAEELRSRLTQTEALIRR